MTSEFDCSDMIRYCRYWPASRKSNWLIPSACGWETANVYENITHGFQHVWTISTRECTFLTPSGHLSIAETKRRFSIDDFINCSIDFYKTIPTWYRSLSFLWSFILLRFVPVGGQMDIRLPSTAVATVPGLRPQQYYSLSEENLSIRVDRAVTRVQTRK